MTSRWCPVVLAAVAVVGCSAPPEPTSPSTAELRDLVTPSPASAPSNAGTTNDPGASDSESLPPVRPLPSAPIDETITPVSKSNPGPAAAAALKACGVDRPSRLSSIAGMGLVDHARDVPRYARMFGTEPQLNTDAPAWVVQLAGRIDYAQRWADNPVCVVIDGQPWTFAPEAYGGPDAESGRPAFNPNPSIAPDPPFRLPPLTN